MKFFKKVFVIFLLVFSSQQVLAKGITTKQDLANYFCEIGKDLITMIELIEDVSGESSENQDILLYLEEFGKKFEKNITKKADKLMEKFVYATIELNQTRLINQFHKLEKINMNDPKNIKKLKKIIAELDGMIDDIKPKNEKEIEKIQDLKNFTDFYKKIIRIDEFPLEMEEKYKKYNFFDPNFLNRN